MSPQNQYGIPKKTWIPKKLPLLHCIGKEKNRLQFEIAFLNEMENKIIQFSALLGRMESRRLQIC